MKLQDCNDQRERKLKPLPEEVRGVHVTMYLASLEGRIDEYLALRSYGLNAIQLDVKDERGAVGFECPGTLLAQTLGAARPYYKPREIAAKACKLDVYLIGRIVVFEDPVLSEGRPEMAVRTQDGLVWRNHSGLGWSNPYDERVWDYNVNVAEQAARAGFDEIMFDYVRFPTDGELSQAVFPGELAEPRAATITRFVRYAAERLRPFGVRVSAAVFGLAATQSLLGIGQLPRRLSRYLDCLYPMVYPSHYSPGVYSIDNPNSAPGRTVAASLEDFRRSLSGRAVKLIPWLQHFSLGREYTLADVQEQIAAVRQARAAGFLLWNPKGLYNPEALAEANRPGPASWTPLAG